MSIFSLSLILVLVSPAAAQGSLREAKEELRKKAEEPAKSVLKQRIPAEDTALSSAKTWVQNKAGETTTAEKAELPAHAWHLQNDSQSNAALLTRIGDVKNGVNGQTQNEEAKDDEKLTAENDSNDYAYAGYGYGYGSDGSGNEQNLLPLILLALGSCGITVICLRATRFCCSRRRSEHAGTVVASAPMAGRWVTPEGVLLASAPGQSGDDRAAHAPSAPPV